MNYYANVDLVFNAETNTKPDNLICVFTTYIYGKPFVSKYTASKLSENIKWNIIPNRTVSRVCRKYLEDKTPNVTLFCKTAEKEVAQRLETSINMSERKERKALFGIPYFKLFACEENLGLFYLMCRETIKELLLWFDRVVFLPPKPKPHWENTYMKESHDQYVKDLCSSFSMSQLELLSS